MPIGILMFGPIVESLLIFRVNDVYSSALAIKHDVTVNQREQSVIFALPDTTARVELIANLANNNVSSTDSFATKLFDATTLCV